MAERKTTSSQSREQSAAESTQAPMIEAFLKMQKSGLGPVQWLGTTWLESMGDFGSELSDFVAERIREDVKTQHEILHCSDPAELQEIQAKFISRAIEQYSVETGRLVELSQEFFDRLRMGAKK